MSRTRRVSDLNVLGKRIKKAEKKVKKLKALTGKMRDELTQRANLAENSYQAIVQIRENVHQLILAELFDAQLLELAFAWLTQNDDN